MPANTLNLRARYNIAPTTAVDIVVRTETDRELKKARWGLIPGCHKGDLKDFKLAAFNARVETVDTSGTFKHAYRRRRCIIPASGFSNEPARRKTRAAQSGDG